MCTSPNTVSAFMLSLSEFACLVSEQHYRFLLQSLNNLEHQIEQHQVERHLMELRIANLNNRPHNGVQMPCLLHPLAELPPFSLTSKANPIDDPSTITDLLRTPLHTTFRYTTGRSIKANIRYQTPERPTWDREGTQSTFSMMMRYDARDVGRKDISLGIVTESIDMMGSNTSQLSGKRI